MQETGDPFGLVTRDKGHGSAASEALGKKGRAKAGTDEVVHRHSCSLQLEPRR